MTHTYENLSFEIAGSTLGSAEGWTVSSTVSNFDHAGYDNDQRGYENFETGWGTPANENFLSFFVGAGTDLEQAVYNTFPDQTTVEAFEREWGSPPNQGYLFALGSTESASYDTTPENYEDFEEEWLSNENFIFAFTGPPTDLTEAEYDVANEKFEDFEEEWDDNENFNFSFPTSGVGSELEAAIYEFGFLAQAPYEDFEGELTAREVVEISNATDGNYDLTVQGELFRFARSAGETVSQIASGLETKVNNSTLKVTASTNNEQIRLTPDVIFETLEVTIDGPQTTDTKLITNDEKAKFWLGHLLGV